MLEVTEGLVLADRYVVDRQLGVGGSGTVWRAHDRVLDRPVAVKVVPEGVAAARLAREARATAGIGVRNVVGVYDVGEQAGAHFLVMEFVDGVDLATLLAVHGALRPELVALVGQDVARGVAAVHAAELVHRDISPANVLVTVEGEVKLTDLGIAQRTDDHATRRLTEAGTVVGTVDYLAPEQVEGREVTEASDVYAVGLLLHAAATGEAPFGGGSVSERLARRLAIDPAELGPDHGGVGAVIATAVQRDPADRQADGRALREALAPFVPDDEQPLREELGGLVRTAAAAGPVTRPDGTDALEGIAIGAHRDRTAIGSAPPATEDEQPAAAGSAGAQDRTTSVRPDPTTVVAAAAPAAGMATDHDTAAAAPDPDPEPAQAPTGGAATAAPDQDQDQGRTPAPAAAADEPTPGVLRPMIAAVVGLVAVIALASAWTATDGGEGGDGGGGEEQEVSTVPIVAAVDHDPLGGGGEHGDEVGLAIDGDPGTEWDTEGYETPELGGLKAGVGLLLDLGEVVDVAAVEVDMGLAGADLVVTVSEERPAGDPTESATALGAAQATEGTTAVRGEAPVPGRWVALWFTRLGPDGGRHRAAVQEVRVLAP